MTVHDALRHGRGCTVLDLIHLAKESCRKVHTHEIMTFGLTGLSPKLELLPGEELPTACPRELLLRIMLSNPATVEKLLQDLPGSIGRSSLLPFKYPGVFPSI